MRFSNRALWFRCISLDRNQQFIDNFLSESLTSGLVSSSSLGFNGSAVYTYFVTCLGSFIQSLSAFRANPGQISGQTCATRLTDGSHGA